MIVSVDTKVVSSCAVALVLGAIVATNATAAPRHSEARSVAAWLPVPARTLATIDCHCSPSAARIGRSHALLERLASRCQESPGRLACISKTATEILRKNGRRRTNPWLLTEVDRKVPSSFASQQPCRYVFALVLTSL